MSSIMPRRFRHVTEFKSNIDDEITFALMLDRKLVNTLRLKNLPPRGMINVDVHDLKECLRWMPDDLMIGVSVKGKLKLILPPIFVVLCVRISFHNTPSDGNALLGTLTARGLKEKKVDIWCRIRCMEHKRQKEYMNREAIPRHVWENIGEPVDEGQEMNKSSENGASGPVVTHASGSREEIELNDDENNPLASGSDSFSAPLEQRDDGELLRGQASRLKYQETPLVEGQSGKVANILSSDMYGRMEEQFGYTLIGYNGEELRSPEINLVMEMKEFRHCKTNVLKGGIFTFSFSSLEQRNKVLENGQLFINKRPLILKRWSRDDLVFGPSLFLSALPIWVRFYNINRQSWTKEHLSEVSRGIGVFLYMDNFTALKRFDYARCCLEVDPFKELPDTVLVALGNKTITIEVSYEWKPQLCSYFTSLCHHATSFKLAREEVSLRPEDSYVSIEELRLSNMAGDDGGGDKVHINYWASGGKFISSRGIRGV